MAHENNLQITEGFFIIYFLILPKLYVYVKFNFRWSVHHIYAYCDVMRKGST